MAKYCIYLNAPDMRAMKQINECDELIINFTTRDTTLPEFLEQHKHQSIVLRVTDILEFIDGTALNLITSIAHTHPEYNLTLAFDEYYNSPEMLQIIPRLPVPYFFMAFVNDWELLHAILNAGASQVYIVESLAFALDKVKMICDAHNAKIRCIPNIAQSLWFDCPDFRKFWVRPEDIEVYDEFVDMWELIGNQNPGSACTYFDIYKSGHWNGALKEIIMQLRTSADSRCIQPNFAKYRKTCQKNCLKCGACDACILTEQLAIEMFDKNIILEKNLDSERQI